MISAFIKAVELEAKSMMDHGNTEFNEKYKLVKSRSNRKLSDDAIDDLLFYIDDEKSLYNTKLKGLGDIEKVLKPDYTKKEIAEIMDEVTTKEEGKTVIAPMSDKRKSIEASITADFDELDF